MKASQRIRRPRSSRYVSSALDASLPADQLVLLAGAFALTAWIISGMDVSGGVGGYIWVSALFGIVNAIIGTVLRILTLPLTLLTLGLFSLIVNGALLKITDSLSSHLTIDSFFWTAIWAAIILSGLGRTRPHRGPDVAAPAPCRALTPRSVELDDPRDVAREQIS